MIKKADLLILADDALQSLLSSPLRTMLLSDNCLGANCSHSGGVLFLSRRNVDPFWLFVASLRTYCCTFTGLNIAVMYGN